MNCCGSETRCDHNRVRDLLAELMAWWDAGESVAMATVTTTFGSAPRQPGAAMVVGPGGEVIGSVSGGCVEGAVYELAKEVLGDRRPVLQHFGVSDNDAIAVGLTCGGSLDVFVEVIDQVSFPELGEVAAAIQSGEPVAVATTVAQDEPARVGRHLVVRTEGTEPCVSSSLGSASADAAVAADARGLLAAGRSQTLGYGQDGQRRGTDVSVFIASYAPRPRMLVFGAIDFTAAVARIGSFLGYHVTVCDARPIFATASRFPDADEVVVSWPHRYLEEEVTAGRIDGRTVICVLTHDPKFDAPLLEVALRIPGVAYIGAMGSRRTHEDRTKRLYEAGLTQAELTRLSSPIGLDLGGRTPEETAVSVAAEILTLKWGGSGSRLTQTDGPVHSDRRLSAGKRPVDQDVDDSDHGHVSWMSDQPDW